MVKFASSILNIVLQCLHQDESSTTSKNYENQLSMMSDHLAGMNEKLTQQKDEIDDLKTQLANTKASSTKVGLSFKFQYRSK